MINLMIPSRGGMNKNLFKQLTKYGVHKELNVVIFIDSDEVELYSNTDYEIVIIDRSICENSNNPVVPKRNLILDYCRKNSISDIFMIDDDTKVQICEEKETTKYGWGSTIKPVYEVLDRWVNSLPDDCVLSTIDNNIIATNKLHKGLKIEPLSVFMSCYYIKIKPEMLFEDIWAEDYEFMLNCLNLGYKGYMCYTVTRTNPMMGTNVFEYEDWSRFSDAQVLMYDKYKDTWLGKYSTLRQKEKDVYGLSIKKKYQEEQCELQ